ncbi:CLCN3 [Cordylochernes scorpioides]|uniref:CLCN3 n=1 Tax=Cordylochernes scorpioides TaxID=51811 RepID=A0ABY6LJG8_9ARAC|nr:CLCN3 [Cordylochernes scorpioides]
MEDQRICIKFCVKNGFKGGEIFWMLQTAYRDAVISRRRVFEWYKRFKEGREETADNKRSGDHSTPFSFPKITFDQKNARKETASLNLEATTDDPELLKRVITGDETWIYGFDSETTQQASEWRFKNEPRPKKARKAPSKVKVMLTVFFDYQGIVHHEFQQQGSKITADSYLGVLRRLREAIRQKRPELWRIIIGGAHRGKDSATDGLREFFLTEWAGRGDG